MRTAIFLVAISLGSGNWLDPLLMYMLLVVFLAFDGIELGHKISK